MNQLTFFETEKPPTKRQSATSRAAADAIAPSAETLRQRVYEFIQASHGATDEQISIGLGMNPSTARPRRVELVQRGLVVDSGERLLTASGRRAAVWIETRLAAQARFSF